MAKPAFVLGKFNFDNFVSFLFAGYQVIASVCYFFRTGWMFLVVARNKGWQ